jgi:hypothetical protein
MFHSCCFEFEKMKEVVYLTLRGGRLLPFYVLVFSMGDTDKIFNVHLFTVYNIKIVGADRTRCCEYFVQKETHDRSK